MTIQEYIKLKKCNKDNMEIIKDPENSNKYIMICKCKMIFTEKDEVLFDTTK